MPARLVQIARGRYKVRWRDGTRNAAGGLVDRSTKLLNLAAASAEKRRLDAEQVTRRELRRGGATAGRILSLPTVLRLWKDNVLATGKAGAPYVREVELALLPLFQLRAWATAADVTPGAIDAWMAEKQGVGVEKPLRQIKTILRFAAGRLRQSVDAQVLLTPKPYRPRRPPPRLLEQHEVDWILALAQVRAHASRGVGDEPYWQLEHLSVYGCRPIDTCTLNLGDFDAVAGELTLRDLKNGETITHPVLPRHATRYAQHQAARLAEKGAQTGDPFFRDPRTLERWKLSVRGQATALRDWYTDNVSEWLLPAGMTGIYLLKDYAITAMDRNGIDDRTKALFTGHLDLTVFQRYKATNQQRARAALDRLGGSDGGSAD